VNHDQPIGNRKQSRPRRRLDWSCSKQCVKCVKSEIMLTD